MAAPTPLPLRRPLLVTGPPSAGSTSVARALAGQRGLCAVVEVVVCDVLRAQVGEVYRSSTAAPFVVALRVPMEVARARAGSGPLTPAEFDALHAENAAVRDVDAEVDAAGPLAEVVAAVEAVWASAGTAVPTS